MPQQRRHLKQSLRVGEAGEDLRASLKIIGWLNDTLDAAAKCIGGRASRDAALVLLILHKNRKAKTGKKLLQLYLAWRGARRSIETEEPLRVGLGQLLGAGLVTAGEVDGIAVSKLKQDDIQGTIGVLLEKGLHPLRKIQLTSEAPKCVDLMRQTINQRQEAVLEGLTPHDRRVFEKLIEDSLPSPPPRPPRFLDEAVDN